MNTFKQESDKYRDQLKDWGQEKRIENADKRFKSYLEQVKIYLGDKPPMGLIDALKTNEYKTEVIRYLTERINRL